MELVTEAGAWEGTGERFICGSSDFEVLNFFAYGDLKLKTLVKILSKREEWEEEMFGWGQEVTLEELTGIEVCMVSLHKPPDTHMHVHAHSHTQNTCTPSTHIRSSMSPSSRAFHPGQLCILDKHSVLLM